MNEYIRITNAPEALGVPENIRNQFVGLKVEVSSAPVIGWLGYSVPPPLFHSCEILPTPALTLSRRGHVVSIEGLISACQLLGDRNELCEWLLRLRRQELHPEFFLVASDWCEYEVGRIHDSV